MEGLLLFQILEGRERENAKASKNKESILQDRDEHGIQ